MVWKKISGDENGFHPTMLYVHQEITCHYTGHGSQAVPPGMNGRGKSWRQQAVSLFTTTQVKQKKEKPGTTI